MNNTGGKKRIAVIAGDGIGKEVMPEGIRVMELTAQIALLVIILIVKFILHVLTHSQVIVYLIKLQ